MTEPQLTVSLPDELVEALAQRVAEIQAERHPADEDRWLDKRELADVLGCGVRWIEERLREGMPPRCSPGAASSSSPRSSGGWRRPGISSTSDMVGTFLRNRPAPGPRRCSSMSDPETIRRRL